MTQQEYEQKKRECFVQFCKDNGIDQEVNISIFDAFDQIFDRAYALGKKFGISDFSDAEGEEMLTVSRNNVMAYYRDAQEDEEESHPALENACNNMYQRAVGRRQMLKRLFGSKCLPDVPSSAPSSEPRDCDNPLADKDGCRWRNDGKCAFNNACYFEPLNPQEPKPAEPKFKVGDKVRYRPSGNVYEVEGKTGRQHYALKGWLEDVLESDLEPYPRSNPNPSNSGELKLQTAEDKSEVNYVNLSQNIKNCDNRLQIAAMAMQGILSNIDLFKNVLETGTEILSGDGISFRAVAKASLLFADALIAESEIIKQPLTKH